MNQLRRPLRINGKIIEPIASRSPALEWLLKKPDGWYRAQDIAKDLGRNTTSITQSLYRLNKLGIVERRKEGDYQLAPVYWSLAKSRRVAIVDYINYLEGKEES